MAKRSFTTDAISVSTGNVLSTLMQIGAGIVLARLLGPKGNGLYSYLLVIPTLVGVVTRLGIKRSTVFYISKKTYSTEDIISALSFIAIGSSILGILVSCSVFYFSDRNDITLAIAIMAAFSIPLNVVINYTTGIMLAEDNIKKYNIFQWIPGFINLLLLFTFLYFFKLSISGALLAYLLSNLIIVVFAFNYITATHKIHFRYNHSIVKNLIKLGLSFTIAGILIKLHYRFDLVLLRHLSDMQEVGYYSLAARLTERWQGPLTVGVIIYSRTALAEDKVQIIKNVLGWIKASFILGILAITILYFLIPYIIPFLFGKEFIPSIKIVQYILPGILMLIVSKTLISYQLGIGKSWLLVYLIAISLILNIILNMLLIPEYGGVGAAIATDISYTLLSALLLIIFMVQNKISIGSLLTFGEKEMNIIKRFVFRKKQRGKRPNSTNVLS